MKTDQPLLPQHSPAKETVTGGQDQPQAWTDTDRTAEVQQGELCTLGGDWAALPGRVGGGTGEGA